MLECLVVLLMLTFGIALSVTTGCELLAFAADVVRQLRRSSHFGLRTLMSIMVGFGAAFAAMRMCGLQNLQDQVPAAWFWLFCLLFTAPLAALVTCGCEAFIDVARSFLQPHHLTDDAPSTDPWDEKLAHDAAAIAAAMQQADVVKGSADTPGTSSATAEGSTADRVIVRAGYHPRNDWAIITWPRLTAIGQAFRERPTAARGFLSSRRRRPKL